MAFWCSLVWPGYYFSIWELPRPKSSWFLRKYIRRETLFLMVSWRACPCAFGGFLVSLRSLSGASLRLCCLPCNVLYRLNALCGCYLKIISFTVVGVWSLLLSFKVSKHSVVETGANYVVLISVVSYLLSVDPLWCLEPSKFSLFKVVFGVGTTIELVTFWT